MAEEKGQQMINEKAFGVSFIPVFVVRRIISYPDEFFSFHLGVCGQSLCHSPVDFSSEALRKNVGRFLSLTVIMQLVFECSYHTNVDHLHFQSCVPVFLSVQYTSFHFTIF